MESAPVWDEGRKDMSHAQLVWSESTDHARLSLRFVIEADDARER